MSKKDKKIPDQVVFNEATEKYEASLKQYATNVGAPAIKTDDVTSWKNNSVIKANHHFKTKFEKIKEQYETMMEAFEYNDLIYKAKFSFEPVMGKTYHLYRAKDNGTFLSLIGPAECSFEHIGSFALDADRVWQKVRGPEEDV